MTCVALNPELFIGARERSGIAQEDLAARFKKLPEWESGEMQPTLKQVEAFARAIHVPVDYLSLSQPPERPIPIPDFRTLAEQVVARARTCWTRSISVRSGRLGIAISSGSPASRSWASLADPRSIWRRR